MLHSYRTRIALPFVILILTFMGGQGVFLNYFINHIFLETNTKNLLADIRFIGRAVTNQSSLETQKLMAQTSEWAKILNSRVTILSPDGSVLADSNQSAVEQENYSSRPEVIEAIQKGSGTAIRSNSTNHQQTIYAASRIDKDGKAIGIAIVSAPMDQVETSLTHLPSYITWLTVIASFLALLLAILIANRTSRPIQSLTQEISKLSEESFIDEWNGELTVTDDSTEISNLTKTFNFLTGQLHDQMKALENERNKIAAVLQEMTDGVLIVDQEGIIQLINPALLKMLDIQEEEPVGKSLMQALQYHQFYELWKRAVETNEPQSTLIEIPTKKFYIQCTTRSLDQVLPGSTLLILQNLTRQRYLETVRRDFISNISHELRTPLASLKALTETLQEGALDDPPAARRFLAQIEREVDSLSHMVSELLELSRIESGQVPLHRVPTSPYDILSRALERLSLQADRAGLKVVIDCPADIPDVSADPPRMEQVVVNLLHNAIKFTPSGGEITLTAQEEGDKVIFSVKDTGMGIPGGDLPRIFERFYKADRARSSGGTGLGLAIARHMVEAHGGVIWAESVHSQGSSFYFLIPKAQQAKYSKEKSNATRNPGSEN